MTDLATLGLEVRSDGVVVATDRLKKLERQSGHTAKGVERVARQAQQMGREMQRMGRTLSMRVTAPLLGIAAAATKMGADFDSELTKINTLVGVSRQEIAGFREEILTLAPALGQQPQEMASALFAVTSAGLRGAEAMATLEAASKAAAIGLGDSRSVALAATAAVTAYGRENLNASEAVEILVGTIEQGNVAAEEVAPVLGRVIGLASEMGVAFEDVGGFIASFTRLGVDAAEATTALRGALSVLQRPAKETRDTFAALGMSVEDFRNQIRDDGFTSAMQNLVDRSRELNVDLSALFPNVRALSGVLGVYGGEAGAAGRITEGVADAVGTLDDRFQAMIDQDPSFAFKQMKAELSSLLIEISANILPAVLQFVGTIRDLAQAFRSLPPETQKTIVQVAGLAAAIGPLLIVMGSLLRSIALLSSALRTLVPLLVATKGGVAALGTVIGFTLGRAIREQFLPSIDEATTRLQGFRGELQGMDNEVGRFTESVGLMRREFLLLKIDEATEGIKALKGETSGYAEVIRGKLTADLMELRDLFRINEIRIARNRDRMGEAADEADNLGDSLGDIGGEASDLGKTIDRTTDEFKSLLEAVEDIEDALAGDAAVAIRSFNRQAAELNEAFEKGVIGSNLYSRAIDAIRRQLLRVLGPQGDFNDGLQEFEDRINAIVFSADPLLEKMLLLQIAIDDAIGNDDIERADMLRRVLERIAEAGEDAAESFQKMRLEQTLGRNLAQAIVQGADLRDALARAFMASGSEVLGDVLEEQFTEALQKAFRNFKFGDEDTRNMVAGLSLAIGQAVGGNLVQGALTAAGAVIGQIVGGPIGSAIGSTIGSLLGGVFGGSKNPRFIVGGQTGFGGLGRNVDDTFQTALGGMLANFRNLERETERAVIAGLQQFDSTIASIVRDVDQRTQIEAALRAFTFNSNKQGASLADLLEARFDAILDTFDQFIQNIVRQGLTLEEQVQRLADIFAIETALFFRRGLGLTADSLAGADIPPPTTGTGIGPIAGRRGGTDPDPDPFWPRERIQADDAAITGFIMSVEEAGAVISSTRDDLEATVTVVSLLSRENETLGETFVRLLSAVGQLDEAIALTGANIEKTRFELIEFADQLTDLIPVERLEQLFSKIFNTFFTDQELALRTIEREGERAQSLLGDIGLDIPLTKKAFRDLFEDLLPTLSPEELAILLEAGEAIANVIEAEERLAREREKLLGKQADLVSEIDDQLLQFAGSAERIQLDRINKQFADLTQRATELGLAQTELDRIEQLRILRLTMLARAIEDSLRALSDEFLGIREGADTASSSLSRFADSIAGAADSIRSAIIRIEGGPLSTRGPVGQRDFLQEQFDTAIAGGDFGLAAQLAPQLAQQIRLIGASSADADRRIRTILDDLRAAEEQARSAEIQRSDVTEIGQTAREIRQSLERQTDIALQTIDKLSVLSDITGQNALDIADRLEVPIDEMIGVLVDVQNFTEDQIKQLGTISTTLGVGLSDLARRIGVEIGTLADQDSMLNRALRTAISDLPPEFSGPLLNSLRRVEASGDVTGLENLVRTLPFGIQNELAPFFDGIDFTDVAQQQLAIQEKIFGELQLLNSNFGIVIDRDIDSRSRGMQGPSFDRNVDSRFRGMQGPSFDRNVDSRSRGAQSDPEVITRLDRIDRSIRENTASQRELDSERNRQLRQTSNRVRP